MNTSIENNEELVQRASSKSRLFRESWLQDNLFKGWLTKIKAIDGTNIGFCKLCNTSLQLKSGKSDIQRHMNSSNHRSKESTINANKNIVECFAAKNSMENTVKKAELKLCAFIAEHDISILTMDHLSKLCKNIFPDSKIANKLSCARTKTSYILKNIFGTYQLQCLSSLLNKHTFSICIDESTDLTNKKLLTVVARICENFEVHDFFLCLLEVVDCDAISLYEKIKDFFEQNLIKFKEHMIGFAADGANNMTGVNHSVATLFKKDIPNLHVFKCICHSLALCSSYSCKKLPSFVETLTRNIYNYLSNSPKRHAKLIEILILLEYKPLKILHPCQTRWLSLEAVVNRIIELYEPLKIYFAFAANVDEIDNAKLILENLNDNSLIYFQFLKYVLNIINTINKIFQAESIQVFNMYGKMKNLYMTIIGNFMNIDQMQDEDIFELDLESNVLCLDYDEVYLGIPARQLLDKLPKNDADDIIKNCIEFYREFCSQLRERFEFKNSIFKLLNVLNPQIIIQKKEKSLQKLMSCFPNLLLPEDIQNIDNEFREMRLINFDEYLDKDEQKLITVEDFWKKISEIERGSSKAFPFLSKFIQSLFALPHSSANVERIFSIINANKTKKRNKLSSEMLSALLWTKSLIKIKNCNCINFEPNIELYKLFSNAMYNFNKTT